MVEPSLFRAFLSGAFHEHLTMHYDMDYDFPHLRMFALMCISRHCTIQLLVVRRVYTPLSQRAVH